MSISVSFRYIIDDVPAAVRFYTSHLGFKLKLDAAPAFAAVEREGVVLNLSGEGSSGKRQLPDGRAQLPGGWNRIQVHVMDLAAEVTRLRDAGVTFLTPEVVAGPGGSQVVIEDPSGNRVELFQPAQ
jgi:catechol 2,3-dioxygenase-like lactoylglutathione lyase family enzyme